MFEFVKEVRYDIFLVYSGLILVVGIFWVHLKLNPSAMNNLSQIVSSPDFLIIWIMVSWFGVYIFIKGISEFQENYNKEKEMQMLERGARAVELKKNLDSLGYKWDKLNNFIDRT